MPDRWTPLQELLETGLDQGVYTAAVALVGLEGRLLWEGAAGRVSRHPGAAAVTTATVFDLASLTKPLATTLALMVLAAQGRLSPATPLGAALPASWLPRDKQALTLGSLLTHRSGLPAWRPFYQELLAAPAATRPALLARLAAATPLEHAPDTITLYSDLGFMLLKAAAEHLGGQNLDRFCRAEIYQPLGLKSLGFIPLPKPAQDITGNRKLKTENCCYAATEPGLIPGRPAAGEVHDENAWAAGGVAGHAGLFGTGREVFHLASCLYRTYGGDPVGPFTPAAVRFFLSVPAGADRAYGFDTPAADLALRAAGRYFSPHSIGHLGFT
ncbi:MAG: serine hydrolase domain-containing protein, partial [Desulfobaccales bacterium]